MERNRQVNAAPPARYPPAGEHARTPARRSAAPVTTAADGTFSVTDTPPVGGEVRYDVVWDGNATYRGSSASVTIPVAKRSPVLTLTGPTTAEAGKRLRLSGSLTLDGRAPSPAATLAVSRTIYNNRQSGITYPLADVVTDSRGDFRFYDTPAQGGRYVYTVRWAGSAVYEGASADHEVSVSSSATASARRSSTSPGRSAPGRWRTGRT
jgi:hypothetical protein